MPGTVTIAGTIARHDEPLFWGNIVIDAKSGIILRVVRGRPIDPDFEFGPECLIFAGFGDIHIHAREDNTGKQNYKEDYSTASAAALNGGVVHASTMPNQFEPVRGGQQLQWHRNRVKELDLPVVMLNYIGVDETTEPLGSLGGNPYKMFFGKSVGPLTVIYASAADRILARYRNQYVSFHVEYEPIVLASASGKTHTDRRPVECVNEGLRLLLPLIKKHNIRAKLCHWSIGGESFKLIEEYRQQGCEIELEVSPLHLLFDTSMTDADPSLWTKIQMNPAIQSPADREQLIYGLKSGFIQYLATDHAPHTEDEKFSAFERYCDQFDGTNKEIAEAMREENLEYFREVCCENNHSGAPWLDTYGLVCCYLMKRYAFTSQEIARVASYNPGQFANRFLRQQYPDRNFGKGFGDIAEGYVGSLTVLDLEAETLVDRANLKTKVGWSALEGITMPGAVRAVFIEGRLQ